MTTRLTPIDDQFAIIIDRSTLDSLGIDEQTPLEVSVGDREIRIRVTPGDRRSRLLGSARRMMDVHDETFRKLAE